MNWARSGVKTYRKCLTMSFGTRPNPGESARAPRLSTSDMSSALCGQRATNTNTPPSASSPPQVAEVQHAAHTTAVIKSLEAKMPSPFRERAANLSDCRIDPVCCAGEGKTADGAQRQQPEYSRNELSILVGSSMARRGTRMPS